LVDSPVLALQACHCQASAAKHTNTAGNASLNNHHCAAALDALPPPLPSLTLPITGQARPIFPFTAVIGQEEMKLALILNVIDPKIGGVMIMGDRGTGTGRALIPSILGYVPMQGMLREPAYRVPASTAIWDHLRFHNMPCVPCIDPSCLSVDPACCGATCCCWSGCLVCCPCPCATQVHCCTVLVAWKYIFFDEVRIEPRKPWLCSLVIQSCWVAEP
jgi:hypothetical protein